MAPRPSKAVRKAARRAAKVIGWLDEVMHNLCNDPMTHAMGAPVDDFYEEWSARYRRDLNDCLKDNNLPERLRTACWAELERFLP